MYIVVKMWRVLPVSGDSGRYNVAGSVRPLNHALYISSIDVAAKRTLARRQSQEKDKHENGFE
jgi:hypothetical protein